MIHPDEVNPIAELAYELFRQKYPNEPAWVDQPESLRIKWRDNVVDADKIRNRAAGSEIFQEQCIFDAIAGWDKFKRGPDPDAETEEVAPPVKAAAKTEKPSRAKLQLSKPKRN